MSIPPNANGNGSITVRTLCSQSEYEAAVSLQEKIWGSDIRENVPVCLLQVSQEVGGVTAGAFAPSDELVGFVFGLTGPRDGRLAHWSHLLAVEEDWRNLGVGRALKAHQREVLLKAGVEFMYWTFDPLESRNAHLNFNKLGAAVEKYVPDYYGEDSTALTDTAIGTDRFIVRWDLHRPENHSAEQEADLSGIPLITAGQSAPELTLAPQVRVEVPADIQSLKSADPDAGATWRQTTRLAFMHYLGARYEVTRFVPGPNLRGGFYLLEAT